MIFLSRESPHTLEILTKSLSADFRKSRNSSFFIILLQFYKDIYELHYGLGLFCLKNLRPSAMPLFIHKNVILLPQNTHNSVITGCVSHDFDI